MAQLTCADLTAGILEKTSTTGLKEATLCRIAWGSIQGFLRASDRWERLETPGDDRRMALWLTETEAAKLVRMLSGERSADGRLVRQEIEAMFAE